MGSCTSTSTPVTHLNTEASPNVSASENSRDPVQEVVVADQVAAARSSSAAKSSESHIQVRRTTTGTTLQPQSSLSPHVPIAQHTVSANASEEPMAWHDLVDRHLIGSGHFARVYEVRHAQTGLKYALKSIRRRVASSHRQTRMRQRAYSNDEQKVQQLDAMDEVVPVTPSEAYTPLSGKAGLLVDDDMTEQERASLVLEETLHHRELMTLRQVSGHPNICGLVACFESTGATHLVMELCEGGSLFKLISERGVMTEKDAAHCIRHVVKAVEHLHRNGIMHRDIKPENLVVLEDPSKVTQIRHWTVKLCDFGLAKSWREDDAADDGFTEDMHSLVGTPAYAAPELLQSGVYGPRVDMWAVGVIIFVLLGGYHPFDEQGSSTPREIMNRVLRCEWAFDDPVWPQVSVEARRVIQQLLQPDPSLRMTATQFLSSPWITRFLHHRDRRSRTSGVRRSRHKSRTAESIRDQPEPVLQTSSEPVVHVHPPAEHIALPLPVERLRGYMVQESLRRGLRLAAHSDIGSLVDGEFQDQGLLRRLTLLEAESSMGHVSAKAAEAHATRSTSDAFRQTPKLTLSLAPPGRSSPSSTTPKRISFHRRHVSTGELGVNFFRSLSPRQTVPFLSQGRSRAASAEEMH